MSKIQYNLFLVCVLLSVSPTIGYAYSDQNHDQKQGAIEQELDCVDENTKYTSVVTWEDVCYTDDYKRSYEAKRQKIISQTLDKQERRDAIRKVVAIQYPESQTVFVVQEDVSYEDNVYPWQMEEASDYNEEELGVEETYYDDELLSNHGFLGDIFSRDNPLTNFEMGFEASYIRYEEPNFIEEIGEMYGIFAAYTYRTSDNSHIKALKDVFTDISFPNMYKLDGTFTTGEVDYVAIDTTSYDNLKDYKVEVRGIAGYDIPLSQQVTVMPYAGFGYRYLNDDLVSHIPGGYHREANYYYVPLGVETVRKFDNDWLANFIIEYDLFLHGKQKSHLEDSTTFDTLTNGQGKGYGLRGSVRLMKENERIDFFVEPFVRYWNIKDSDTQPLTINGTATGGFGLEPANNSREYGIKLGANF